MLKLKVALDLGIAVFLLLYVVGWAEIVFDRLIKSARRRLSTISFEDDYL